VTPTGVARGLGVGVGVGAALVRVVIAALRSPVVVVVVDCAVEVAAPSASNPTMKIFFFTSYSLPYSLNAIA
jgi:hypothetical protein